MTSLEDETEEALARPFPYLQRKWRTGLAVSGRGCTGVLGTNWAR